MSSSILIFATLILAISSTTSTAHYTPCSESFFLLAQNHNFSNNFCKKLTTLGAELAWKINDQNDQEISIFFGARLYDRLGWLAWGINPAKLPQMVGTRAIIGIRYPNGSFGVNTYNITSDTKMGCKLMHQRFDGANNDVSFRDLSMRYKAALDYHIIEGKMVLSSGYEIRKLNHVWQVGYLGDDGVTPAGHPTILQNVDSSETVNFRTGRPASHVGRHRRHLRTVHGILNIAGWGIFLPSGVIVARYCKYPLEWKCWFKLHICCQIIGYILGTAGWIIGLALGTASKFYNFKTHRLYAIFIFTFTTLQMLALRLKPEKKDEYRKYWNMYHHFLGFSLLAVISINIFNGIDILKPDETWRWAYIGILVAFAATVAGLEIYTWTKFKSSVHHGIGSHEVTSTNDDFPQHRSPLPPPPRP
ncbi:cytochrome b561 and DOMON domain-containing protein At5g35735-like [Euphorbia lathyris]|uniref:cytochrome b561 and DOMON domain-containing protein At5g35735-like n=1 Tax=Euphorbia lathyris TaxID=212925 RepID=UPI003313FFE8